MKKRIDYSKITRTGSWLGQYMTTFENVETAESYDFWCGVWLLSNVIGRRIKVERPHAPVYLNTYAILCAESGITRKSTAVRFATSLLQTYHNECGAELSLLSGGITSGYMDDMLAELTAKYSHAHLALSSSELVSLLGRGTYSSGLPGKLTDLYDCPAMYTRASQSQGALVAKNVYVTLLGASTPSWLVRAVNPDVVEGGFTSRCLFIIEEKPKRLIAWPEEASHADRLGTLSERLRKLKADTDYSVTRAGGIHLTRVARECFTEWYEQRKLASDPFGSSFEAREDHHILRLAGILCASDGSWVIDEHHLANSIAIIGNVKYSGSLLFGTGVASSKTYTLVDRLRGALIAAGRSGLSQSALTALCRRFGTNEEQKVVLSVMHEMQLVQKFSVESGDRGRPTTMFRATKALSNAKAMEEIVDLIVPQEV
jgi:hypothetical protein